MCVTQIFKSKIDKPMTSFRTTLDAHYNNAHIGSDRITHCFRAPKLSISSDLLVEKIEIVLDCGWHGW